MIIRGKYYLVNIKTLQMWGSTNANHTELSLSESGDGNDLFMGDLGDT